VSGSQVPASWQSFVGKHASEAPDMQTPALQVSFRVQPLPSSHEPITSVYSTQMAASDVLQTPSVAQRATVMSM
jgi:hypothetical protein